jgi:hypothetical protein
MHNRRHERSGPVDVDNVGKLNLKPKLHAPATTQVERVSGDDFSYEITVDTKTTYDPNKYRDAEEAKRVRRLRRAEC